MIQCNGCGFTVNELMKFALMNNVCPSCGGSLFSAKDNQIINTIQAKLISERFASKLTEELVYDISLFIFNELKDGLGKSLRQEFNSETVQAEYREESEEDLMRKEIEQELGGQLNYLNDEGESITEDVSDKAEKLRRMHKQRLLQNPNLGQEVALQKPGAKSGQRVSRAG